MKKLNEFLTAVNTHIDRNGFVDVLELAPYFEDLQMQDWESMVQKENGRPVNTTIYQSDLFRMIIIHWAGNQQSSLHGHPDGGGLIKVLSGQLEEMRYDPEDREELGFFGYGEGDVTYIHDDIALHQVKNPEERPAYSLHMYTRKAS